MFKSIWKNLKTTLAGSVAGGSLILTGIASKNVAQIVSGIAVFLMGLLAKDAPHTDQAAAAQTN